MALLPPDPVYTIRNVDNVPVYSLAFSFLPGGLERLLAGSKNGYVYAYNLQTNRCQQKIQVGQAPILHLTHHTMEHLITQEKGGKYKIFRLTNTGYKEETVIETDYPGFCRYETNTKLETLYVPDKESRISVFNYSGEKVGCLEPDASLKLGDPMCMKHLLLASDRPALLVGYEAGWLLLWDLNSSQIISKLETNQCPMSVDFHYEQGRGMIGNASDVIQIFSIGRKDLSLEHKMDVTIKNPGINKVQSRLDGKVFATGGWDGHIRIFSWYSLRPLVVLTEHKQAVQDVVYSTEKVSMWKANLMAAGGLDGAITLWDLYNAKQ